MIEGERQQEVQRDGLYGLQWLRALPGWIRIIIISILSCQLWSSWKLYNHHNHNNYSPNTSLLKILLTDWTRQCRAIIIRSFGFLNYFQIFKEFWRCKLWILRWWIPETHSHRLVDIYTLCLREKGTPQGAVGRKSLLKIRSDQNCKDRDLKMWHCAKQIYLSSGKKRGNTNCPKTYFQIYLFSGTSSVQIGNINLTKNNICLLGPGVSKFQISICQKIISVCWDIKWNVQIGNINLQQTKTISKYIKWKIVISK